VASQGLFRWQGHACLATQIKVLLCQGLRCCAGASQGGLCLALQQQGAGRVREEASRAMGHHAPRRTDRDVKIPIVVLVPFVTQLLNFHLPAIVESIWSGCKATSRLLQPFLHRHLMIEY
jgi:hypothetical protein